MAQSKPIHACMKVISAEKAGFGQVSTPINPAALQAYHENVALLEGMKHHMALKGDELQRMEDEGGPPLANEHADQAADYFDTSHRIGQVLESVKQVNGRAEAPLSGKRRA